MINAIFFIISGYLLGSILFAGIAARIFRRDIISRSPDKNYGSANAFRYGGFWCGCFTLLCDMAKGFLPVFMYINTENPSMFFLPLVMFAPVLGHILPVFSKFNGGKAIAVTFGALIGLLPDLGAAVCLSILFLFFSFVLKIDPHCYRTILCYIITTLYAFLFVDNIAIGVGMILITIAVSMKMLSVQEEREKISVHWLNK